MTTASGTLLAFAEGRVDDCSDVGNIDLVMKRSTDGGLTWQSLTVLRGVEDAGGYGNAVPVIDSASGRIALLFAYNTWTSSNGSKVRGPRSLHAHFSVDDGNSWAEGASLASLKLSDWTWVSVGTGHAVQLRRGEHTGRIVVTGEHSTTGGQAGAQLYYSDDGGMTWQFGAMYETSKTLTHPSEPSLVERVDGSLYVNARSSTTCGTSDHRLSAVSMDSGETFAEGFTTVPHLDAPPVFGSLLRLSATDTGDDANRLLLSAPARPGASAVENRRLLAVRSSYDEGETWQTNGLVIKQDRAGYSDMTLLPSGAVGILYETGEDSPHGTFNFTTFDETALDAGQTKLYFPRTSDSSGNGNHAVVHGGAALGYRGSGRALTFDGSDDYLRLVNCPSTLALGESDFTITAWIRYSATSGAHPIVWGYGQGTGVPQFWLRAEPTSQRLRAAINTGTEFASVSTGSSYNDGLWHHVVFRRSADTLVLSVDGHESASAIAPVGSVTPEGPFTIHVGARPDYAELFQDERVRLAFTTIW